VAAGGDAGASGATGGPLEQPASSASAAPTIAAAHVGQRLPPPACGHLDGPSRPAFNLMALILLEALGALALLLFIVWWTMFSGRRKGERRKRD
jgi:hypothetical protein